MKVQISAGFTVPTGDLGDAFDPGFSISGAVTGPVSGMLDWRAEVGYDQFQANDAAEALCDAFGLDCGSHIFRAGGGLQFSGGGESLTPYAYVTVGAYNHELGGADSETDLGMALGGGVHYLFNETWGVGGELRVNGVFFGGDTGTQWYLVPAGHLVFRF